METNQNNLQPFNITEALAGRTTVTRDRKRVLAIWDSGLNIPYPIAAVINDDGERKIRSWGRDGIFHAGRDTHLDFFHPPAWRLPDPPMCKKWHRDDWTEEMLPEGWRPILMGERCRRGDELLIDDEWVEASTIFSGKEGLWPSTDVGSWLSRTRRPLPPAKKRVPLGPEDVPPGSEFRITLSGHEDIRMIPLQISDGGIVTYNGHDHRDDVGEYPEDGGGNAGVWHRSWANLMRNQWEIRRPGETWQSCWKEVDCES